MTARTTLTLSSKNYSSWSLRGWLLCRFAGLDFDEVMLAPDDVCHDLRHPALLPVEGASGGYWLFFTCVPSSGVTDIRVARLDGAFGVLSDPPVRRID